MPKIKIIAKIKNDLENKEINTQAILVDNKIKYQEEDHTNVIYDYQNNNLVRENEKIRMFYEFNPNNKTKGLIRIKELNSNMPIIIETIYLKRKEKNIEIKFKIEEDEFIYQITEIK